MNRRNSVWFLASLALFVAAFALGNSVGKKITQGADLTTQTGVTLATGTAKKVLADFVSKQALDGLCGTVPRETWSRQGSLETLVRGHLLLVRKVRGDRLEAIALDADHRTYGHGERVVCARSH